MSTFVRDRVRVRRGLARAHEACGRAAAGVVRRHPGRCAGAAGQEDLQPVPAACRDRRARASTSPGSTGCIAVDADAPHRRRAGHVHLRGPRRRDAAARADPVRRAAAAHHHARRRGHRPRHRVDQLPQRAAARVGARDGRLHRRRRGRHRAARATTCSTRSPTPTARSATPPGCGSSSSRCPLRRAAARALRRRRAARQDDRRDRRDRRRTTASGSTASTASRSSRGSTT